MANHFWSGSLCFSISETHPIAQQTVQSQFPPNVVSISDTITILDDLGNHIPDKSWMLYLLELFDSRNRLPIELNLICQFNNRDNFWAIFKGINRQKFTKVLPKVGHSYLRRIVLRKDKKAIEYSVTDIDPKETEEFTFNVQEDHTALSYLGTNHFTGVEWWNKSLTRNTPFPVRYKVEISSLAYGQKTGQDWSKIIYKPYDTLAPDRDGNPSVEYPLAFEKPTVRNGNIAYTIGPGKSTTGIQFVPSYSRQVAA